MRRSQNGFGVIEVLILVIFLAVLGFVGWKFFSNMNDAGQSNSTASSQTDKPSELIWRQTENGWESMKTPPTCPAQPILKAPADLSKVTSVLFPGQTRGGNYKPHGGLRFDTLKDNTMTVTAPVDGYLIKGARFIAEPEGEIQYGFDIMNNCGVMYRIGHLRELPSNLQKIVETFPEATSSSASQNINPTVFIKQGDVLATKVGILKTNNTFFDFGVYDYRQENEASKSSAYRSTHAQGKELAWHAVCWFQDWLPANNVTAIAKLPAGDPTSGKNSDYCK